MWIYVLEYIQRVFMYVYIQIMYYIYTHICIHLECMPEKAMAPHSSTLAWRIPWMETPGGLWSMGSLRVRHNWASSLSLFTFMHWRRKWQPTPVFLPGESQGQGSLVAAVYGVAQSWTRLKWLNRVHACSVVSDSAIPWTVACWDPLSLGFSRQEYWSGLPFPSPGDLTYPKIKPTFSVSPALAVRFSTAEPPGNPHMDAYTYI